MYKSEIVAELQDAVSKAFRVRIECGGVGVPQAAWEKGAARVHIGEHSVISWDGEKATGKIVARVSTESFSDVWEIGYDIGKAGEVMDFLRLLRE